MKKVTARKKGEVRNANPGEEAGGEKTRQNRNADRRQVETN